MAQQLTAEDARQSLTAHVESKGAEVFARFGGPPDNAALQVLLTDRTQVRYPCEIVFDEEPLLPGEFAHPVQKGESPEDGFTMVVHPFFATRPDLVPALVLYQLVAVNYGDFASADEAESYGAAALGLTRDQYYTFLCDCADQLAAACGLEPAAVADTEAHAGCGGGGGCSCGE